MDFWIIHIILLTFLLCLFKYLTRKIHKKTWVIITLVSGFLVGGISVYNILSYLTFNPSLDKKSQIDSLIRTLLPLITSIITAFSIVIATQNTSTGEKASKRGRVLDLVKFTNDIIKENDIYSKSNRIIKQLESHLKSNKTKLDILVNNGALFYFDYLNENDNMTKILSELKKLEYAPNTIYYEKQKELETLIQSSDIKDMRKLWILINFLSGEPAVKYGILKVKCEYELDKDWIGKSLIKHSFYSNTILKSNRSILTDFIIAHAKHDYSKDPIRYEEIYRVCDSFFKKKYGELGHFFRTFHRTLKLINLYYSEDPEEYRMQIGLLRAQIPNSVATILFYNAFYTDLGRGMGRELINSNFFGNKDDFYFNVNSADTYKSLVMSQHFYDNGKFLSDQNAHICYDILTNSVYSKNILNTLSKMNSNSSFAKKILKFFSNKLVFKMKKNNILKILSELNSTGIIAKITFKRLTNYLTLSDDLIEYSFNKENQYLYNIFKKSFNSNSKSYSEGFKLFVLDKKNNL